MQHNEAADRTTTAEVSWHTQSVESVVRTFAVDPAVGLSDLEVARSRERSGTNALAAAKGRPVLAILGAQFRSLIVALVPAVSGMSTEISAAPNPTAVS